MQQTNAPPFAGKRREWVILTATVVLVVQVTLLFVASTIDNRDKADFRALFYSGVTVRLGEAHRLYDDDFEQSVQNHFVSARTGLLPFLYLPFAALFFVPLSYSSYGTAFSIFTGLNVALAGFAAFLLGRIARLPRRSTWLACAFTAGFTPIGFTLMQGQVSLLLLVALCGCQLAFEKKRAFTAGLCLAFVLVKFQIALPIALLFLLWRQWQVIAAFTAGALALVATSIAMVGATGCLNYARSIVGVGQSSAAGLPNRMSNIYSFFCLIGHNDRYGTILTAIVSGALLLYVGTRKLSLPLAIVAALLVSYHLYSHDLTLLLLPLAVSVERLMCDGAPGSESGASRWRARVRIAVTLLLLLPPVYLTLEAAALMPLLVFPMFALLIILAKPRDAQAPVLGVAGLITQPTA